MAATDAERRGTVIVGPRVGLCLDFANTLAGRGSVRAESLHSFQDLIEWCLAKKLLPQNEAAQMLTWSLGNLEQARSALADGINLREAIYGIFGHLASGREAEEADLNCLNSMLMESPRRSLIARADSGFGWQMEPYRMTTVNLLAPVIWSAGDLLTGRDLGRVRLCANHQCLWLFFDDSLRGARRWCSMQACGNRAKTRRHYLRNKAG